jgi:hypothetical protein
MVCSVTAGSSDIIFPVVLYGCETFSLTLREDYLRLPTTAARVRVQVLSCGIYGGQSGAGTDFLRVLVSPAKLHSTNCSTIAIIYRLGLVKLASSCRSTPLRTIIKKGEYWRTECWELPKQGGCQSDLEAVALKRIHSKATVFWNVTPCSPVDVADVSRSMLPPYLY